ncbi:HD domain-containing protein [Staphylococcus edaphicus]|uniref:HD domain-containing protein n=1 Tax=Staphylococcus edaphicus TaxID=1955013 RepID=A0A2C6VE43_9STAP|nr:HD domain-containing protein [Staphylococcus edaphicus]PHK48601.1 phosphohydrolase [Staphylococcus edaphicus]UQW82318.1 HD domain-containing protein [Staphylococcus edaphicus]
MKEAEILKLAHHYMYQYHKDDSTGHDVAHVNRVLRLATYIAEQECVENSLTIQLASLLHDTVDHKLTDQQKAFDNLKQFLVDIQLPKTEQQHILHIIEHMSYKKGQNNAIQLTIEGQIVRDADRLDAIGAIGIARTFQFAGHFNEPMWVEHATQDNSQHFDTNYDEWSASAIKHFYEKLLKLKSLMHTETAKKLAAQRHQYMENFINQFFEEWYF